jgi:hypothetical protein
VCFVSAAFEDDGGVVHRGWGMLIPVVNPNHPDHPSGQYDCEAVALKQIALAKMARCAV